MIEGMGLLFYRKKPVVDPWRVLLAVSPSLASLVKGQNYRTQRAEGVARLRPVLLHFPASQLGAAAQQRHPSRLLAPRRAAHVAGFDVPKV